MPDLHRLPFYALAGTQDAITLPQVIRLPKWRCQDGVILVSYICRSNLLSFFLEIT
jgi:hypothetical protein